MASSRIELAVEALSKAGSSCCRQAAADRLVGDQREEALDLVQPRAVGGDQVRMPAQARRQPCLDLRMAVCGEVLGDAVDARLGGDGLIDLAQEGRELLVPATMPLRGPWYEPRAADSMCGWSAMGWRIRPLRHCSASGSRDRSRDGSRRRRGSPRECSCPQLGRSLTRSALQQRVHIEPPMADAFEPADLMQAMGASAQLAARDELDAGSIRADVRAAAYLEPQPSKTRRIGIDACRPRARMPSVEQVAVKAEHVGGIARAHQCLRRRRLQAPFTLMPPPAACGIAQTLPAWAGRKSGG
jgi:hypothetical protein